ncbi:MAG: hypothetical protein AAF340_00235 [Pseudomonadota bacterium]
MKFSNKELDSFKPTWLPLRPPQIRIAVPALFAEVKSRPAQKKVQNKAHLELLNAVQRDMDGLMPLPVARRKAKKRF